jgi:hypothetical protein
MQTPDIEGILFFVFLVLIPAIFRKGVAFTKGILEKELKTLWSAD